MKNTYLQRFVSVLLTFLDNGNAFNLATIRNQQVHHPVFMSFGAFSGTTALSLPHQESLDCATNNTDEEEDVQDLSRDEIARYSRHLVLPEVGMAGQRQLKISSVLVVGAGGLGSPCLLYLAAAGVGHIGIVDGDTVDTSNLQRQIIHGTSTVGQSKCNSAQQRLEDVNPLVQVRAYPTEFTAATALDILGQGFAKKRPYDLVIDGSDNFPTKYLINDACAILNVPWIYSAILAFEGQLSVFNWKGGPDYRDLLPVPPPPGEVPSCAEGGVLGVLPGTMGCLQATEAIKVLLQLRRRMVRKSDSPSSADRRSHNNNNVNDGDDGICSGRVLVFDALKMRFSEMGLEKDLNRAAITELIDYQGFCGGPQTITTGATSDAATGGFSTGVVRAMDEDDITNTGANKGGNEQMFHTITPKQAREKLQKGWCPWVLDVRLTTEHDIVALPFTDRVVPHRTVRVRHVPATGDVLVYCKSGARGGKACAKLVEQGVDPSRLYNMVGGILGWQEEVDPSMPRY